MELAKRDAKKFALLFVFSLLFAVAFTVIMFLFLKDREYVPMIVALLFSVVSLCASVISLFRIHDAKLAIEVIRTMTVGSVRWRSLAGVACTMGWTEKATKKFINRCEKLGYIRL